MLNGLAGPIHTEDFPDDLARLQRREQPPGAWFISACDEKFTDEDLSPEGNAFAQAYYANDVELKPGAITYVTDYAAVFGAAQHLYGVPDSWESYDRLAPTVSRRFMEWRSGRR